MGSILAEYLKAEQFLEYDKKFFVANSEHRWGRDPMHYIYDFYHNSYEKITIL